LARLSVAFEVKVERDTEYFIFLLPLRILASLIIASMDITIRASCHCKSASYSYTLPASCFPLKSSICNCNSCRHVTGQLAASFAVIPSATRPDVSRLSSYASSDHLTRYFCPRCGAHVATFDAEEWEFCSGILNDTRELLNRVQLWVADTRDGGLSAWLSEIGSERATRYLEARDSEEATEEMFSQWSKRAAKVDEGTKKTAGEDRLYGSCHCKGVEFYITRPSGEPRGHHESGKWWLGDDGRRYTAYLETDESCRLTTGFEFSSWLVIPRINIFGTHGAPFDIPASTLQQYDSSPGVHRYFCGRCGASVFYRSDSRILDIWDIAVGLLRSDRGAGAQDWLEWRTEVNFIEEATDANLANSLADGLKASFPSS